MKIDSLDGKCFELPAKPVWIGNHSRYLDLAED